MPDFAGTEAVRGPALAVAGLRIGFPDVGTVLTIPEWDLAGGNTVVIEGASGAGKSSLLHALAGIERPADGNVRWGDVSVWSLSPASRDRWRRESVGLVFQDIHLLDGLSALDNVLLPLLFDHARVPPRLRERARTLLARLGIAAPDRPSSVMSRGERQRVALARALLRAPPLLFADEPTASLDRASAAEVGRLLLEATAESGATLVLATHDPVLLQGTPLRFRLEAGQLIAGA